MPLVVPTGLTLLPAAPFGATGEQLPRLGFGCMGLTPIYGAGADEEAAMRTIEACLDMGVKHFDTADVYGLGKNEELVGRAIKKFGRDRFFLASKFGFVRDASGKLIRFDASPAYIKQACAASLARLGVETIDLYYAHRIDPKVPVEETVAAMAELVKEGKVRYLGLSECSAETLRRACKVHPIAAVQSEYSLFSLDPEQNGVLDACRELGVAFVAFSPLGRGFLSGTLTSPEDFGERDYRRLLPRFQGENFEKNMELVRAVEVMAKEKGCTASQLAIAWTLRNPVVFPIPGTKSPERVVENVGSALVEITDEEDKQIRKMLEGMPPAGERYNAEMAALVES
ncbi:putative oxidoreductase [Hyaloraphidium curvatum]|nr:putative oxidoreductase [Hyaloraphidium curvatum]